MTTALGWVIISVREPHPPGQKTFSSRCQLTPYDKLKMFQTSTKLIATKISMLLTYFVSLLPIDP